MSVTSALSSALTGLTATQRQAEIVFLERGQCRHPRLCPPRSAVGRPRAGRNRAGVQVQGVTRQVDVFLQADRRVAEAASGDRDVRAISCAGWSRFSASRRMPRRSRPVSQHWTPRFSKLPAAPNPKPADHRR